MFDVRAGGRLFLDMILAGKSRVTKVRLVRAGEGGMDESVDCRPVRLAAGRLWGEGARDAFLRGRLLARLMRETSPLSPLSEGDTLVRWGPRGVRDESSPIVSVPLVYFSWDMFHSLIIRAIVVSNNTVHFRAKMRLVYVIIVKIITIPMNSYDLFYKIMHSKKFRY